LIDAVFKFARRKLFNQSYVSIAREDAITQGESHAEHIYMFKTACKTAVFNVAKQQSLQNLAKQQSLMSKQGRLPNFLRT